MRLRPAAANQASQRANRRVSTAPHAPIDHVARASPSPLGQRLSSGETCADGQRKQKADRVCGGRSDLYANPWRAAGKGMPGGAAANRPELPILERNLPCVRPPISPFDSHPLDSPPHTLMPPPSEVSSLQAHWYPAALPRSFYFRSMSILLQFY